MFMWRAKLPLRQATSHAYAAQVFETLVRFRTHDSPYSKASVSLRHQLLMSHNVAVHCLRGRTLVAFGGMAHAPASTDWQGNDLGIWRTSTPATAPPLLWSTPRLVLTGDPEQTGCVDVMREGPSCEYDGKLSVVHFQRSTLLFTRSNLAHGGGGRHLQLTRSADGVQEWSQFEQLQIAGVAHGSPEVNIYFLAVRVMRGRRARLLGVFPGSLGGRLGSGVFSSTSADGVHWSTPRKLLSSAAEDGRTRDYPVDGAVPPSMWPSASSTAAASSAAAASSTSESAAVGVEVAGVELRLALQIDVDLRHARTPSMDRDCDASVGRPMFCSYRLTIANTAASAPHPTVADPQELVTSVRAYLGAIYPAAHAHIRSASDAELISMHSSLDYFYSAALCSLLPRAHVCVPEATNQSVRSASHAQVASSPYLPPGAYYVATERPSRVLATNWTAFTEAFFWRHPMPVLAFAQPTTPQLVSSWAARLGPAPSWTSPLAAVRYALHPSGLRQAIGAAATITAAATATVGERATPTVWHAPSSRPHHAEPSMAFEPRTLPRVADLFVLRDGDVVEIEQWGGWAAADCPPICGLWANVWRGTGLAMRVASPLVSLSKATAVVDMLLELGARSPKALMSFATATNLLQPARVLQATHEAHTTPLEVCVAAALLMNHPCEAAASKGELASILELWLAAAKRAHPADLVATFLALASPTAASPPSSEGLRQATAMAERRYMLHWLYGVCGVGGPLRQTGYGWDGLVALLACLLGHHTVVLAASPNDNGLLHQELVDFELPHPHGWPTLASPTSPPNALQHCQRSFDVFQADAARGPLALQRRRRELLWFWRNASRFGPKFVLPRRVPAAAGSAHVPRNAPLPPADRCTLRFGAAVDEPAGMADSCQLAASDEQSRPTAAKACWAWCDGALSETHALVSLLHVHDAAPAVLARGRHAGGARARTLRAPAHHSVRKAKGIGATASLRGYCGTVAVGGDCDTDSKGAWHAGSAVRSLSNCQHACRRCSNCHFVSFSRSSRLCAWYEACSTPLLHSAQSTTFATTQVAKSSSQPPVDFHVPPSSQAAADASWESARVASATRRFGQRNSSELCYIRPRRRFGLPAHPDILGPSQQLLGHCVPVVQQWPAGSHEVGHRAVDACCALCADTLGCTAWTLLPSGECCLRRWQPEGAVHDASATAGTVLSPCTIDCALPYRPFGWGDVRIPTASAADIPWLGVGRSAPDASIRRDQRSRVVGAAVSEAGRSRIAVCVAGQVRTLVHPLVTQMFYERALARGRHDLFAVLSTGWHDNATGPHGADSTEWHASARNVPSHSIYEQHLPEPCELASALRRLRPLRTRFVLNSHDGREPCRSNLATIQMVATASCVDVVESYERDRGTRGHYKFMLRTRPDVYWKAELPLDRLAAKLGYHRLVLTTNDWHLLAHRALWPVLRSLANVPCDQRCNGRRGYYLGTLFDEMNEYCALARLADHIHYASTHSRAARRTQAYFSATWLHTACSTSRRRIPLIAGSTTTWRTRTMVGGCSG